MRTDDQHIPEDGLPEDDPGSSDAAPAASEPNPYERPRSAEEMRAAAAEADAEAEASVSGEDMEEPPFLKADRAHPLFPAIRKELMDVFDPEIPVDIYQLGLIYGIELEPAATGGLLAKITMTLTAPACPVAEDMPGWVEDAMARVDGIDDCEVELVWDPPWDPDKMTELAKMELGIF